MLNVVALMGRLVADPELRHTPNGVATCTFRIAVDRSFVRAGEERKACLLYTSGFPPAWQLRNTVLLRHRYPAHGQMTE